MKLSKSEANSVRFAADANLLLDVVRAAIARSGGTHWTVKPTEAWCYVAPPEESRRKHGWKLHVSATPLSAPLVLARAADVLVRRNCSFKFATDIPRVAQMTDIRYSRGGSGKFITVYPHDDEQFRVLALEIHEATVGLAGPHILSDKQFRTDSLVYYRYGEFHSDQNFTDDGVFVTHMIAPDGSVEKDERNAWFSPPAWAPAPFPDETADVTDTTGPVLLDGRFCVRSAIRHANKGGVYRAVDEHHGTEVVVKQARRHVGADLNGTAVRDLLREEARMLDALAPLAVSPAKVALFEQQGDVFLVEDLVEGDPLHKWVSGRMSEGAFTLADFRDVAARLVGLIQTVHDGGFIIRDVKPPNIIVTPTGAVRIIDVEHICEQGQSRIPIATPMFAAPEVMASLRSMVPVPVPKQASDCFSLGVTLFCLATGRLPDWEFGDPHARRPKAELELLFSHMAQRWPLMRSVSPLIAGLTAIDPSERWSLKRAAEFLDDLVDTPEVASATARSALFRSDDLDRLIDDGVKHLQRSMTKKGSALWKPSSDSLGEGDPSGAWKGAAGIVSVLARAASVRQDPSIRDTVAVATTWMNENLFSIPRLLPGLSFGRSGTAWALYDAATLLGDNTIACRAIELAKKLPGTWANPDITHGLSGAGMAHLHLWQATGDDELWQRVLVYADAVIEAAERSGPDWMWPVSRESDSVLAGTNVYGFAHGIAGAGAFLLSVAENLADSESAPRVQNYLDGAVGAGDTLMRAARTIDGTIEWPISVGSEQFGAYGQQWCNGPAGIGTFLIRLWSATGEQRFLDGAERCAETAMHERWVSSIGACCGLSGTGQFLLDMADFTGQPLFRTQAEEVAGLIQARSNVEGELVRIGGRTAGLDYASGSAGVLDFLLRLRNGGQRAWMPKATKALIQSPGAE